MNNNKPTTAKLVGKNTLITILLIIGFFILVGIIAVAGVDGERTTTDDTPSETTEQSTDQQSTDLELSVRTGNFHMTIANKESGVLKKLRGTDQPIVI